jgi:cold shock CspA family protein
MTEKMQIPIQNGQVKWFSKDKGFGYIVGTEGQEHYFNVRDIDGVTLPDTGDEVRFNSVRNDKGLRAKRVTIERKASIQHAVHSSDYRVLCAHCNKKMIPRMMSDRERPSYSVCPFCAGTYKDFSAPFSEMLKLLLGGAVVIVFFMLLSQFKR